jgi:hypothetical protein
LEFRINPQATAVHLPRFSDQLEKIETHLWIDQAIESEPISSIDRNNYCIGIGRIYHRRPIVCITADSILQVVRLGD